MKHFMVSSVLAALVLAACSQSADAQLFRRWRRNDNYNYGYYGGYNNTRNGGYYPTYAVPSYRTGAYQSGVVAPPAAPRATTLSPATPWLGPNETVISGANVRADGAAAAANRFHEPMVPGPAGSTSPNVGATANP